MAGINLAFTKEWQFSLSKGNCVFISHKKEDEEAAVEIGNYLMETVGVNIYLDVNDCILHEAVDSENDKKIVGSVIRGLECCTHLLCITSDKTRLSWWVPYEIGYAEKKNLDITVLKLKDVEDIPSFLKIKKVINNINQFLHYVSSLNKYGDIFADRFYKSFSQKPYENLKKYIDED